MKLAVLGHSLAHIRQQNFFRLLTAQEHVEVTVFCPDEWGALHCAGVRLPGFSVHPLSAAGPPEPHPDRFLLLGLREELAKGGYDWVYIQQEPNSLLAAEVCRVLEGDVRKALFTWQNIPEILALGEEVLRQMDLLVCGNDVAETTVRQWNERTVVLPQVGVDTDHFQPRECSRHMSVGYVGRSSAEKGIRDLLAAWPATWVLEWQDYRALPWWYSQMKTVVCYSQDTPWWREQAMPYVSMEALSCGAFPIVSDGGSIPFWHREFAGANPGVEVVPKGDPAALRDAIMACLDDTERTARAVAEGRAWLEEHLSNRAIARSLAEALRET